MPGRNIYKIYLENSYYHIFNRGHNKADIFKDSNDYAVFLNLLKRCLGDEVQKDGQGREYPNFYRKMELLAFCLMPNHFHLFIHQVNAHMITDLLKSLSIPYSMYFNKKYQRIGPVFQTRYKATLIDNNRYFQHVSRYIHLNPPDYQRWEFSSLAYYMGLKTASWVKPERIVELFNSRAEYLKFLDDYKDHKAMLDELKTELANY